MPRRGKKGRKRQPATPKMYAYPSAENGTNVQEIRVHADEALPKPGLYEYASRGVHRRKFPKRETRFFQYTKNAKTDGNVVRDGMTLTHAMMQSLIADMGEVSCRIEGAPFHATLRDVKREFTRVGDPTRGVLPRRGDLHAVVETCTVHALAQNALNIEVAVTNPVQTEDRYHDLVADPDTTLELFVARDARAEANIARLEKQLRRALISGELEARWIRHPGEVDARFVSIDEALADMQREQWTATEERDMAIRRLSQVATQRDELQSAAADGGGGKAMREQLARHDAATNAIMDNILRRARDEERQIGMVQRVFDVIFPWLGDSRKQRASSRVAELRLRAYRELGENRRGILKQLETIERADRLASSDGHVQWLALQRAFGEATVASRVAQVRLSIASQRVKIVEDLKRAGRKEVFVPMARGLNYAIDFDHRRWCAVLRKPDADHDVRRRRGRP